MKRMGCFLTVLSIAAVTASCAFSAAVVASEKKEGKEAQKAAKKETAKDAVCGMEVHKDKALKMEHDGKKYFFCSKKCEEIFKKEPAKYLKNKEKHKEGKKKEEKDFSSHD